MRWFETQLIKVSHIYKIALHYKDRYNMKCLKHKCITYKHSTDKDTLFGSAFLICNRRA